MIKLYQVDAFTDEPFAGNPAAVCLLDRPRSDAWMQAVAAEMNLSETAFLLPQDDAYSLRWFTPAVEVDLCGHATLASAHVLDRDFVSFATRSGDLPVTRDADGIHLDFPALAPEPASVPAGLAEALGSDSFVSLRSRFDHLCVFASAQDVLDLQPDFGRLHAVDARGVIATAPGGRHDFVSRFFAPQAGIHEDPVTGSAHCVLAPYWCQRLGRPALVGYQASARGGAVAVRWEGGHRVILTGRAVTVMQGELTLKACSAVPNV